MAPFCEKLLNADESPLLEGGGGGVSMTSGPDEIASPLPPGFFIREKEPNVELLLKAN